MKHLIRILLFTSILCCLGCVSTESRQPQILSGEAPVEDVIAKGDASFAAGDYRAAAVLYQIAIKQNPMPESWFKLGLADTHLNNRDQAIYAFMQTLELEPGHAGALEKMGLYYTSKGDIQKARKYLDPLVAIAPENWKVHNAFGVIADLEGDFTAAREHYTQALKLRPDLAILWNNLGYSVYLLGDYPTAKIYMTRALDMDANLESARANLALIFVREGNYDQALAVYSRTDDMAKAYTNVGYLAYQIGEYDKAEELLEQAIRRSPTYNKSAHAYLAATRQAKPKGEDVP